MPLRDHFRSPVNDKHTWDELHGGWPMMIVRALFDIPLTNEAADHAAGGALVQEQPLG